MILKPYKDKVVNERKVVRTFSIDVDESFLEWHRDEESRIITVLSGKKWKFQRDNELPYTVCEGDKIKVEKHEWHRIIKGESTLVLLIEKHA